MTCRQECGGKGGAILPAATAEPLRLFVEIRGCHGDEISRNPCALIRLSVDL
jgi:hypothetical protein